METPDNKQIRTDRRTLIKGGLVATGAAWAAPQILNTAVAGASTTGSCYALKFEGGSPETVTTEKFGDCVVNPGDSDPITFNTTLGGLTLDDTTPLPGVTITEPPTGELHSHTINLPPGCTLRLVSFKSGDYFYWMEPGGTFFGHDGDCNDVSDDGSGFSFSDNTITSAIRGVSHVTVVVCCSGS